MATRQLIDSWLQPLRTARVPVLVYHGLTASGTSRVPWRQKKYWVSTTRFREQLFCIQRHGFQVALLSELWNAGRFEAQAAALTFDDGRSSDYQHAFPLLLECGMRAEFFVNTATIGEAGCLNWRQMNEMQKAGMSFQSHGHEHTDLSRLPRPKLIQQLKDSKQILEDRLGKAVSLLALPYGRVTARVLETALEAGYCAVCHSREWLARPGGRTVNRVTIYGHTDLGTFRGLLRGSPFAYGPRAARSALLYLPKRALRLFWQPQLGPTVAEDTV